MNEGEVRESLRNFICKEVLLRPDYPLSDDEALITGGLISSHSLVRIAVFIEDQIGVYIPDTDITVENWDTLNGIVARIMAGP